MNKLQKSLSFLLLYLVFFCTSVVYANSGTTTIVLHDRTSQAEEARAGTNIGVYEVTEYVRQGKKAEEIAGIVRSIPPFSTLTTDKEGLAKIELANRKNNKNTSYLFLATDNKNQHEIIQPILLNLPILDEKGQFLTIFDLYPKHYPLSFPLFFHKHGLSMESNQDLGALSGAVFVLSKQESEEVYLMKSETGALEWTSEFRAEGFQKESLDFSACIGDRENFHSSLAFFVSDNNGRVSTGDYKLPAGTYKFKEIEPPSGYMLEVSSEIVAEIPLDVTKEIMLHLPNKNGEEENVSQEKAIYYNKQRGNLPNTNGVEQKVSRNLLPSTNEIMRAGWCLVGTVLVGVFFLVRRKGK
ncbi:hypothetical protein SAMN02745116_01088 [Pilibacter termitis]|uniref:Cna protein B-type domain-containing protein n=1 Tax=Pilibacter termitis TaxID=263852 RepID=A0A1T4MHD2_9ENTE|nr:SpaA isopeptide-forming pilin-related protein [Pilibacter termitis]SJZ66261.1 hypothetical protein SAMN02745116_01088 [Pilibacter termitis]